MIRNSDDIKSDKSDNFAAFTTLDDQRTASNFHSYSKDSKIRNARCNF